MSSSNRRPGYTLIELVVTILIIGVLTSISVPQYMKTVETGKADDAVSLVNMIGTTNKMFALDHNNNYAYGTFPATPGGVAASSCATQCLVGGAADCISVNKPAGPPFANPCLLVCCKYLADQDWGDKSYAFGACDAVGGAGSGAGAGGGTITCATHVVAGAKRATSAPATYASWGYSMADTGLISVSPVGGGAPPPTF
jgi:prepilin-type N-terminal cleavage/methylation domain-containing protein